MPKTAKEIMKLFKKKGYVIVKGQGKGSHVKMRNSKGQTVIIPNHGELKKGIERCFLKMLDEDN